MSEIDESIKAFASFRVLNGDASAAERDQLFRNMAQLFSYVSDRCEDEQVIQYDEVLCHLAELVEVETRTHVANLLAPLDRAPGSVVVKLAQDTIDVARPLLEFSNVLSDDDLIEIIQQQTEEHRIAIAGRKHVGERVGDAIVENGGRDSVVRLVRNNTAKLGDDALQKIAIRAVNDTELADDMRGRDDIDWGRLRDEISLAGGKVLEQLSLVEAPNKGTMGTVSAVVYNRIRNRAGFNAQEWKVAWNQVKALNDRRQLNNSALARFARFGYGHHAAAALTLLLRISPEVLVKWLATQDYVAVTVAGKAFGLSADLFEGIVAVLPWRDFPAPQDLKDVRSRFETISKEEASGIFELWRRHAFRKSNASSEPKAGAA